MDIQFFHILCKDSRFTCVLQLCDYCKLEKSVKILKLSRPLYTNVIICFLLHETLLFSQVYHESANLYLHIIVKAIKLLQHEACCKSSLSFRFNRDGVATNHLPNIRHLKIIPITRLQKTQTNGNTYNVYSDIKLYLNQPLEMTNSHLAINQHLVNY